LATSLIFNTLSTPRGGQYQLLLPDGTKVWLNAASSITYPVGALTKEIKIKIEGEAYFEVAKNKELPFIVDIGGRSTVEVLGTHFNVNGYTNEGVIRTTLLEGSVKVTNGQSDKVLKPGQQSEQAAQDQKITVHNDVDTDKVLAWKNGLFNFEGASLPAVMHQLERWYDITVQYEGAVPAIEFRGGMDRNVNLSAILQFLAEMKIKYTMQGHTLIISK
jgi:ferric-dicitrate binding protein FerR (iron transport regulator)